MWKWPHLKSWSLIGTKRGLLIHYGTLWSYTKVKGHQRSCKMGWKCQIHLIWKVEVRLEPILVSWYKVGTSTCSWGQKSQVKVKGHVRSICKVARKCKIWLICVLEDQLDKYMRSRSGVNLHHPHTVTASDTSGSGTVMYFWKMWFVS